MISSPIPWSLSFLRSWCIRCVNLDRSIIIPHAPFINSSSLQRSGCCINVLRRRYSNSESDIDIAIILKNIKNYLREEFKIKKIILVKSFTFKFVSESTVIHRMYYLSIQSKSSSKCPNDFFFDINL